MTKQIVPVSPACLNSNIDWYRSPHRLGQADFACSADSLEYMQLAHGQTTEQHSNIFVGIKPLGNLPPDTTTKRQSRSSPGTDDVQC
jgi:hypothetical protein